MYSFDKIQSMSLDINSASFNIKKKVKVQVYSLISSISSNFYMFTPWSLHLFIRVSSQLHGEHAVLQPFRRIELS